MEKTECGNPIEKFQTCQERACIHFRECLVHWSDDLYLTLQAQKYKEELLLSKAN